MSSLASSMSSSSSSTPSFYVHRYSNKYQEDLECMDKLCSEVLEPLYGSPQHLRKQLNLEVLGARIFTVAEQAVGVLIFQRSLCKGSLVSLCSINKNYFQNKGLIFGLIEEALNKATDMKAQFVDLFADPEMQAAILEKGFYLKDKLPCYAEGLTYSYPLLFSCTVQVQQSEQSQGQADLFQKFFPSVRTQKKEEDDKEAKNEIKEERKEVKVIHEPFSAILERDAIHLIRKNEKSIKVSLNKEPFTKMTEGIRVRFWNKSCPQDDVVCQIIKIVKYTSFVELIHKEGFKKCLPETESNEELLHALNRSVESMDDIKKYGVLAFHFRPLNIYEREYRLPKKK